MFHRKMLAERFNLFKLGETEDEGVYLASFGLGRRVVPFALDVSTTTKL